MLGTVKDQKEDTVMTRRTLVGLTVAVSIALIAGAMLTSALAQGPGMHGAHGPEMMKRMISARLDEALDQANVTPEQRTAIHASRDRAFATLAANRPDPRAQRDLLLSAFEADQLDMKQVQAMSAQMDYQHQAIRNAVAQAIVEIHDTLTPEQRRAVAEYVRTHGPGSHHGEGMR
jgi:periplasmic protein CpxP/Spy